MSNEGRGTLDLLKEVKDELDTEPVATDGSLLATLIEIIKVERRHFYGSENITIAQRRDRVRDVVDAAFNKIKGI